MSARVVIVDAGGSNIGSLLYAFARLGVRAELVGDAAQLRGASHVVLPGVGAVDPAMRRIESLRLGVAIRKLTQPVLGICLGMQLLYEGSAEGTIATLGVLSGRVERLANAFAARVPHVGWNRLARLRSCPLSDGIDEGAHAYFVHSYAAAVDAQTILGTIHGTRFAAAVANRNFFGTQFHPEKSGAVGACVLQNFLRLT